jgi:hypothetical protein
MRHLVGSKPSSFTDFCVQAGLPRGVLNFVPMSVEDIPKLTAEIIAHPAIRKIAVGISGFALVDDDASHEPSQSLPDLIASGRYSPVRLLSISSRASWSSVASLPQLCVTPSPSLDGTCDPVLKLRRSSMMPTSIKPRGPSSLAASSILVRSAWPRSA